jgi:excisionase family DNA binding protein
MMELPRKELLRVDEVAEYFSVTERTVRLWIAHGHLDCVRKVGIIRIPRISVLTCKFNKDGKEVS